MQHLFDWIHGRHVLRSGATLRLDPLSATMILVVTGIGLLIHIYASATCTAIPATGASSPT